MEKERIIIYKNKMYNLDMMSKEEIENLREMLLKDKESIETKLEAFVELEV